MAKQRQHLRSLKAANTANQFRATLFAFQMSLFIIDANTLVLLLCPICLVSMHLLTRYNVIQYARLPEWVTRQRNSRVSRLLVSEIYYLIVRVEIRSLFFVNLLGDNRNWIHTQKRYIACLVTYFYCLVAYHWGKILRKRELNRLSNMEARRSSSVVQSNR